MAGKTKGVIKFTFNQTLKFEVMFMYILATYFFSSQ